MDTIAIGDIHGRADLLESVISKSGVAQKGGFVSQKEYSGATIEMHGRKRSVAAIPFACFNRTEWPSCIQQDPR